MASPTRYNMTYDFTGFQSANPNTPLPADKLEIEFINLERTTGETITNLNLIQRSDGKLQNRLVEFDSLSDEMKALLGTPLNPRGPWQPDTAYARLDLVSVGYTTYIAMVDHASFGSFTVDLVAGKWLLWANPGFVDGTSFFQKFSGDGTTTAFTVSQDMGTDENGLIIFINDGGWKPMDPASFTINGTTLTFLVAPPNASNNIYVFAPAKILSQAAAYAVAAGTSATSAFNSATAAASSATAAANSATAAAGSATSASNSATAAATSATNAASSASSASSSASSASTSATNAANSASSASTSATNAGNSATAAASSATTASNAATTATNAANSASSDADDAEAAATSAAASAAAAAASAASVPIHTFNETTDPTVNDDETQGFSEGSVWINTVDNSFFICTDPAEGAAVWSAGGGTGSAAPRMILTGAVITVADEDRFIGFNSDTFTAKTVNIGSPAKPQTVTIKDAAGEAGTDNITIVGDGVTIDGEAEFVIDIDYQAITLTWDGTSNWMVS